jgi:hypothetical protein
MSADEDFLARWSRRKREVAETEKTAEAATPPVAQDQADVVATNPNGTPQDKQNPVAEFDLASLPPLDSITAISDIRDFLRAGVPAELTRAALRRAWSTDPAIRDFVGLAENAWDFTDPNAMPGFGPLKPTDDVPKMLAQIMSRSAEPAEPEHSPPGEIQQTTEQDSSGAALATAPDDRDKSVIVEPDSTADEMITPVTQTSSRAHRSGAAAQQPDSEAKPRNNLPHRSHGGALPH